jgi:type I restriction enzyme S subunit
MAEQEKIVEILEEQLARLDAAVKSVQTVRERAAQFRRSLLYAASNGALTGHTISMESLPDGWRFARLGDCLAKLRSGKRVERGWSPQCHNHPIRNMESWGVLKTTAVQMGEYQPEHHKELPTILAPRPSLEVRDGDFLVTTTGPRNRCGIVCHVKTTPPRLIFSGKILRFRVNESLLCPDWLLFQLISPDYQKAMDSMKVGTSDSSVSIGNQQVLDIEISVPPMNQQVEIVEIVQEQLTRLEGILAVADEVERKATALRRSLLHSAFSGELTRSWREANV